MFEVIYHDRVRYSDCDMHGHLNHARFLAFMEQGRIEYLKALGMNPHSRESIPFIVVHASCDYKAPALLDEPIAVGVRVPSMGNTSFAMEYEICGKDGELKATGKTVQVYYDYQKMRKTAIPEAFRRAVAALKKKI